MEPTPNLPKNFRICTSHSSKMISTPTVVGVDIISTPLIIKMMDVAEMNGRLEPSRTWLLALVKILQRDIPLYGCLTSRSELDLQGSESGIYNHFF